MTLHAFAEWLSQTQISQVVQNVSWIIPSVQSVHILCIAIVISAVFMVDLRLLGVIGRSQPTAAYTSRFLTWIWPTLVVLLASGSILIIGEPARSLMNPAFILKMSMLICVIVVTLTLQGAIKKNVAFWELSAPRRNAAKLMALVSLLLLVAIVFAGRWIAYLNTAGE